MNLPRIYSISTVGILKHLHQDYLIHPVRTDFTGNNGIGKSIIADLIQLIFISDRSLIEFGTDSLDEDQRKIETLPLGSNEGYAFLNIEMLKDQFITIGVCIPSKTGIPIKPFIIFANSDTKLDMEDLAFSKDKLLTAKDFLDDRKAVLPLQDLAKSLKKKLNLHLLPFQYKDGVAQYYSILYHKEILPINLAMEDNLKAFAKIIQSFSKAKGLDIKKSKALKAFLFEDSGKEHIDKYQKYEGVLNKLLNEFKSLEADILDIEAKQGRLTHLKALKDEMETAQLSLKQGELLHSYQNQKDLEKEKDRLQQELNASQGKRTTSEGKTNGLKQKAETAQKEFDVTDNNVSVLHKYKGQSQELEKIQNEIQMLESLEVPKLDEYSQKAGAPIDLAEWSTENIAKEINAQSPLLQGYRGLKNIETQHSQQKTQFESKLDEVKQELKSVKAWISALEKQPSDGLFAHLVKEGKALTKEQESVLNYLIELNTSKPERPSKGNRYIKNLDIIKPDRFESDEGSNGLWLALGDLKEFVPFIPGKRLFDQPENLATALTEKLNEFKDQERALESIQGEIQKALRGQSFKGTGLEAFSFDTRIAEHASIRDLNQAIGLINNIGHKLDSLHRKSQREKQSLEQILEQLTVPLKENISLQVEELAAKKTELKNSKNASQSEWEMSFKSLTTLNGTIERQTERLKTTKARLEEAETEFQTTNSNFKKLYPDEEIDFDKEGLGLDQLKDLSDDYTDKQKSYEGTYQAIMQQFEETKKGNELIQMQIANKTYSFRELESVLLGPKIGYLDKITPHLKTLNGSRDGMMQGIRDNMIKLFSYTRDIYEKYKGIVKDLNTFFKGQKISEEYYVNIGFNDHPNLSVGVLDRIIEKGKWSYNTGELQMGESVQDFIEDFVQKEASLREKAGLIDLLNPKSYFELSVKLTDKDNNEISGSTGESYSAIALLGIARLSEVQTKDRKGIKFIILEESANLDRINFNTFPKIAKERGYQIITMTPRPYGTDSEEGLYLHQLIKGKKDKKINYGRPASYFRNKDGRKDLDTYLEALKR